MLSPSRSFVAQFLTIITFSWQLLPPISVCAVRSISQISAIFLVTLSGKIAETCWLAIHGAGDRPHPSNRLQLHDLFRYRCRDAICAKYPWQTATAHCYFKLIALLFSVLRESIKQWCDKMLFSKITTKTVRTLCRGNLLTENVKNILFWYWEEQRRNNMQVSGDNGNRLLRQSLPYILVRYIYLKHFVCSLKSFWCEEFSLFNQFFADSLCKRFFPSPQQYPKTSLASMSGASLPTDVTSSYLLPLSRATSAY